MNGWPSIEQIERERRRLTRRRRRVRALAAVIGTLAALAVALALVSALAVPIMRVADDAMSPTLNRGEIVAVLKGCPEGAGFICAFHEGDAAAFARVIARAGSWVNVDGDGGVFVDGRPVETPCAIDALGDVEYPCQVPENALFVLRDRSGAQDSRYAAFGFVAEESVIGQVVARVWPLASAGTLLTAK